MDVKKLALSILKAETEESVIHLLNNEGLWKNLDYWKPFGANENNVSTIRNQQSKISCLTENNLHEMKFLNGRFCNAADTEYVDLNREENCRHME